MRAIYYCKTCGTRLHHCERHDQCRECRSVCSCGRVKDPRAKSCVSCGMSAKAIEQWKAPATRERILAGIRTAGKKRRIRLEDLSENTLWQRRQEDGRYWTWYWDENENKHTVYRYQWMWWKYHGQIPIGYLVHHRNLDETDDRLDNLELLTVHDHAKLHGALMKARSLAKMAQWTCQQCGKLFKMKPRGSSQVRKFCSVGCRALHQRSSTFK